MDAINSLHEQLMIARVDKSPDLFTPENQKLLCSIVEYYHSRLPDSPSALEYLRDRGIVNGEVLSHFKIGFSDRSLSKMYADKPGQDRHAMRGQLQRIGVIKPNGRELFHGSIVVPIIRDGVIHQVYGYKITPKLRKDSQREVTLTGSAEGIFNVDALVLHEEVIICPSVFDVLAFWVAGQTNVVCDLGGVSYVTTAAH